MDFEWLQYVGNPFSVIAVIAAVMGTTFRALLKRLPERQPVLITAVYGMFLISILSLGLGVLAVSA